MTAVRISSTTFLYDVFGAHFVAEVGNETGTWRDNIAIRSTGRAPTRDIGADIAAQDLGYEGNGFWFKRPADRRGRATSLLGSVSTVSLGSTVVRR